MTRYSFSWFMAQILLLIGMIYAYHAFLKDESKNDFIRTIISILVYYLVGFVLPVIFIKDDNLANIINLISLIGFLYLIRRPSIKQLMFSFVLEKAISSVAETLSMLVYYGLEYLFKVEDYSVIFIYDIVSLISYYLAIKIYRKEKIDLSTNILYLILLLALNQEMWLTSLSELILNRSGSTLTISYGTIIIQIFVVVIISILLKDYISFKKIKLEDEVREKSNEEIKRQLESLGDRQSVLNKVYKDIQSADLNYEMLDDISSDLKTIRTNLYSDNASVNALLSYFDDECKKENINLSIEVKGSLKDKLEDYDLNTLLSNILKNAIEASNDITLKIINKNDNILITCDNTNDKKIKKNKLIHGNGTPIIQEIVNKYHGVYSLDINSKIAKLKVMMNTN